MWSLGAHHTRTPVMCMTSNSAYSCRRLIRRLRHLIPLSDTGGPVAERLQIHFRTFPALYETAKGPLWFSRLCYMPRQMVWRLEVARVVSRVLNIQRIQTEGLFLFLLGRGGLRNVKSLFPRHRFPPLNERGASLHLELGSIDILAFWKAWKCPSYHFSNLSEQGRVASEAH